MNNAEQWISLEYQLPTEADLPIWVYCPECKKDHGSAVIHSFDCYAYKKVPNTHWKHAKSDIPVPPRAETLAEKDQRHFTMLLSTGSFGCVKPEWHAFKAGIAYERAEIAKILAIIDGPALQSFEVADRINDVVSKLRARVKGTAAR